MSRVRVWVAARLRRLAMRLDATAVHVVTDADVNRAVQQTCLRQMVEAVKGRELLPGEDLTVEARVAISILRRLGLHAIMPLRDGRLMIQVTSSLMIEIGGFMAWPQAPAKTGGRNGGR